MKKQITIGLLAIFTFIPPAYSAASSAQDVREISNVCMYSQRLLKDYALIGMGVDYNNPADDLIKGSKSVDKYLKSIESHNLKKQLNDEVLEIKSLWKEIKPKLLEKPTKDGMVILRKKVEAFNYRCQEVADHIAKDTNNTSLHYTALITQLSMESQRLAALYIMKAWGVKNEDYYKDVEHILEEYKSIYNEILNADEKFVSTTVKEKLKKTERYVAVFSIMARSKSGRYIPSMAERSASKLYLAIRNILKSEEAKTQ